MSAGSKLASSSWPSGPVHPACSSSKQGAPPQLFELLVSRGTAFIGCTFGLVLSKNLPVAQHIHVKLED
jgi:hypothetical protein